MENITLKYELSLYNEIKTIISNKVYIVSNTLTDEIFIKKYLSIETLEVYKSLKGIKNKNVAEVIDYFECDDKLIVIEEFINGKNLEYILEDKVFSNNKAISTTLSICDGLKDLHNRNKAIVHRDLKPSNIMINSDNIVKIIDFDAARLSNVLKDRDTVLIGTAGYASPEQFGFAQTDNRSDIYSIGILLNYMILKKHPMEEVVGGKLGQVIRKAIQVDRIHRYQNVEELKVDLLNSLDHKMINKTKSKQINLLVNLKMRIANVVTKSEKILKDKKESKIKVKEEKKLQKVIKENSNKNVKNKKWFIKKFLKKIVGFRSGNILKGIIAITWYFVAAFGWIGSIITLDFMMFGTGIYMFMMPNILLGNGFGSNRFIPLINSKNLIVKIICRMIYALIITVVTSFILV